MSEFRKVDVAFTDTEKDENYHTAFRCKNCNTIIISLTTHSWVCCPCFKNEGTTKGIFIDGGFDYIRGGGNMDSIERLQVKIR